MYKWKSSILYLGFIVASCLVFSFNVGMGQANRDWIQILTQDAPSKRSLFAMSYDPIRDRVVLYGGIIAGTNDPPYQETWEYDGSNWELIETPNSPPGLREAYMEYFPPLNGMILFGGTAYAPIGTTADTWLYDGMDWTKLDITQSPPPRVGHSMAYDNQRGVIVMFGGQGSGVFNDTWEFDGTNWYKKDPVVSPYSQSGPRRNTDMTYDKARAKIVLYGGNDNSVPFNDTWEFDGLTWEKINTPTSPYIPRSSPAIAYLDSEELIVLFGGVDETSVADSTWMYDGTTWTQVITATSPPGRAANEIAYKASTDEIVLFGGSVTGTTENFNDTWVLRLQVISVTIDIKPGSTTNPINPKSKGKIPVAILTSDTLDASLVDVTTILFGKTGNETAPVHSNLEDIDADGDIDLILHFKTQETGIECWDDIAILTGENIGGIAIRGSDFIITVGCK